MAGQDSISQQQSNIQKRDRAWPFWPIVPLYPYGQRPTLMQEVVAETIWTYDQYQGIFYVVVPIRMTVVRLQRGGFGLGNPVRRVPGLRAGGAHTGMCGHGAIA